MSCAPVHGRTTRSGVDGCVEWGRSSATALFRDVGGLDAPTRGFGFTARLLRRLVSAASTVRRAHLSDLQPAWLESARFAFISQHDAAHVLASPFPGGVTASTGVVR